jgi:hypothetical protein
MCPAGALAAILVAVLLALLSGAGNAIGTGRPDRGNTATTSYGLVARFDPDAGITAGFVERWTGVRWVLQRAAAGPLYGVSCPSTSACIAAGTALVRWNGRAWSRMREAPLPRGWAATFMGVSCPGVRACVAAGYEQDSGLRRPAGIVLPLAERWDGRRWTVIDPRDPGHSHDSQLNGVDCRSLDNCMAVGSWDGGAHRLAERWNGRRWTIEPTTDDGTNGGLTAVSCPTTADCVAVGGGASLWEGTQWINQPNPAPDAQLSGVSCVSTRACLAVGARYPTPTSVFDQPLNPPVAERWDGARWSLPAQPPAGPIGERVLMTAACLPAACYVAGGNYGASILRFNGASWGELSFERVRGASEQEFTGVSCIGANACTAVGYYYS